MEDTLYHLQVAAAGAVGRWNGVELRKRPGVDDERDGVAQYGKGPGLDVLCKPRPSAIRSQWLPGYLPLYAFTRPRQYFAVTAAAVQNSNTDFSFPYLLLAGLISCCYQSY